MLLCVASSSKSSLSTKVVPTIPHAQSRFLSSFSRNYRDRFGYTQLRENKRAYRFASVSSHRGHSASAARELPEEPEQPKPPVWSEAPPNLSTVQRLAYTRLRPVINSLPDPIDWAVAYGSGVIHQGNPFPTSVSFVSLGQQSVEICKSS